MVLHPAVANHVCLVIWARHQCVWLTHRKVCHYSLSHTAHITKQSIHPETTPCLKKCHTFGLLYLWHTCMDFDIFGRNLANKAGNQKTLYYATSNNLCFCTTWQTGKHKNYIFWLNWTVLHAKCTIAHSSWKKKCHLWCVWQHLKFVEIVRYPINTVPWLCVIQSLAVLIQYRSMTDTHTHDDGIFRA